MRGPYERLKYDLRRVWECPVCQHREKATGDVTWMLCRCQKGVAPERQQVMKLVDDTIRRTGYVPERNEAPARHAEVETVPIPNSVSDVKPENSNPGREST